MTMLLLPPLLLLLLPSSAVLDRQMCVRPDGRGSREAVGVAKSRRDQQRSRAREWHAWGINLCVAARRGRRRIRDKRVGCVI